MSDLIFYYRHFSLSIDVIVTEKSREKRMQNG